MTYLSGREKTNKRYINYFLGFIAFALFIYFWPKFKAHVYPIVEPVAFGYSSSKSGFSIIPEVVSTYFSSRTSLANRNADLELAVERLENELANKNATIRELEFIGAVMQNSAETSTVILYPLAEDVTTLYSTILFSKGFKDGVKKNSLIFVRGMQPVCEIIEVYDKTSLCELLSKTGRVTEGVTASSTLTLTLSGIGGGSFVASVPKGMDIQTGEVVYLRSNPTFTLGTVISIKEDDQATGVKIYVTGAYNPAKSSVFYMNTRYEP